MTRGRRPERTLTRALEIAEDRGIVEQYRPGPGAICNFTITIPGCLVQVRVKRVRHLRCSLQWLEREAEAELAGLRLIASSSEISRELWVCAPNSTFRFFRVCDKALAELDRDGRLLPVQSPAPAPAAAGQPGHTPKTRSPAREPVAAMTSPSENPSSEDHRGE
jgi:hypothetical protein